MASSDDEDQTLQAIFESDSDSNVEFEGFEAADIRRYGNVLYHQSMDDFEPANNANLPCDVAEGWNKDARQPVIAPFDRESKLNVEMNGHDAIDYFKLFFDEEMLQILVVQTNIYAEQKIQGTELSQFSRLRKWHPVDMDEMKVFFALVITMGLVSKADIDQYWSRDEVTATGFFNKYMTRDRFQCILSNLHLSDNTLDNHQDPLFKIRPMISYTSACFRDTYIPEESLSYDEATCPWKGRLRFRVYNPAKPARFGIKLFQVSEAKSGYCLGYDVYTGQAEESAADFCDLLGMNSENLTKTTRIVIGLLAKCGLLNHSYKIYMDNYFTSPELFHELELLQTYACGTLRTNRIGTPKAIQQKRKLKQGEIIYRRKDNLLVVKYHDKRDVNMLSTFHEATVAALNRNDRNNNHDPVMKPTVVVDYISNMGGVDLTDQFNCYNTCVRRCKKWWRKLFMHLFNTCLVNAYCLYSKYSEVDKKKSHYDFRIAIVKSLIQEANPPILPQPPRRQNRDNALGRLAGRHMPEYIPAKEGAKRRRPTRDCVACNKKKKNREGCKRKQTSFWCSICEVALCVPDCFRLYHTYIHYRRELVGNDRSSSSDDN